MPNATKKQHWENIYHTKDTTRDVSWYQDDPRTSVDLIVSTGVSNDRNVIDVGGGDSRLVDNLLGLGFKKIHVLDISAKALKNAKNRLGNKAQLVTWIESDILEFNSKTRFDIWHDRATFHFLTKGQDITRYVEIADKLIKPKGYLIISAFSMNGPKKCSGLDITQYSENSIKKTFKNNFTQIKSFEETHTTPFNTEQKFLWSIFRKEI